MTRENNIRLHIGKRIAELRRKKKYSQAKLAELTGMTSGNIARIELGKYSTGIDILDKIALALDTKLTFVSLYVDLNQAKRLKKLGFDFDTEIDISEPEYLLQNDSKEWTPSKNTPIKIPQIDQALNWITLNFEDKFAEYANSFDLESYDDNEKLNFLLDILLVD